MPGVVGGVFFSSRNRVLAAVGFPKAIKDEPHKNQNATTTTAVFAFLGILSTLGAGGVIIFLVIIFIIACSIIAHYGGNDLGKLIFA